MDFPGFCFMRGRDRAFMVKLSDLVLVPYQERKERLVPTILGQSVPGSTFIHCFRCFCAHDVAKDRKCSKLDLTASRGLNSSPLQEQNFQLTHDMTCQRPYNYSTAEPVSPTAKSNFILCFKLQWLQKFSWRQGASPPAVNCKHWCAQSRHSQSLLIKIQETYESLIIH